ncbi:MAG TPA: spore maturation protein [Candidatus Scatomorpha merdigallinarum]|nr:spore maturation protein [Candidatus Scatomorpha merdigallinarum]
MSAAASLIPAAIIALAALYGVIKGVDVFEAMTEGVMDGLRVVLKIFPSLVALLTAVYMLRASGALDALITLLEPLLSLLGIPPETGTLMLLRPISGSGALAVAGDLIAEHGADSIVGRTAAVMLGSTETTFYVIAVYFAAAGVKKTRYAVPAALCADLTGFIVSSWCVSRLWGGL